MPTRGPPPLPVLLFALLLLPTAAPLSLPLPLPLFPRSDDPPPASHDPPCTITSPTTGSFFDLRPLMLPPDAPAYTTPGHDYNTTFHLNICAPTTPPSSPSSSAPSTNNTTSAFYTLNDEVFSLGQPSTTLILRGKKLLLEYTSGSPCHPGPEPGAHFTKSTLLSFLCDRDPPASSAHPPPEIAFAGALSHCAYFFEIRTPSACATLPPGDPADSTLGPLSIFGVIAAVFLAVYALGGCVYQRTVMNARGWRQVPHYGVWRGVGRACGACCGFGRGAGGGGVRLPGSHGRHASTDYRSSAAGQGQGQGAGQGGSAFSRRLLGFTGGGGGGGGWGSWGTRSGRGGARAVGPMWARGGGVGGEGDGDGDGEVEDENRLLDQLEGEWDDRLIE